MPSRWSTPDRKSAALLVVPGGFEVSIRTYCCSSVVTSSCCCAKGTTTENTERKTEDTETYRRKNSDLRVALRDLRGVAVLVRRLRRSIAGRREIERVEQHRERRVRLRAVLRPQPAQ